MKYKELRCQLVETGKMMFRQKLTHGTSGNISLRIPGEEKILITPSSVPYEEITEKDIMLVNFKGDAEEEGRNPSVETPFHLAIYKSRPDVGCIVHSHSLCVLAVAAHGISIPVFLDEMFSDIGGNLEVCEYALPGSEELADHIIRRLGDKNAVLLANHGAVCCGKTLSHAYDIALTVEKICEVFIFSSIIGRIHPLSEEGVEYQRMMYEMKQDIL